MSGRPQSPDSHFRTLDELQPDDVADCALAAIFYLHLADLAAGMDSLWAAELRKLKIYAVMQRLTEYAQRGLPVRDWTQPSQVGEGIDHALNVLYGSASSQGRVEFDLIHDTEATGQYDCLRLVLVAATARWRLLEG